MGATAEDEMCNFYLMYWVDGQEKLKNERCQFCSILSEYILKYFSLFLNLCHSGVSVSARLSTPGAGYGPSGVTFQSPSSNPQYRSQSLICYLLILSCSFVEQDMAHRCTHVYIYILHLTSWCLTHYIWM